MVDRRVNPKRSRPTAQPTPRGLAVVGLLVVLLVLALTTNTPELVPLLVATGVPVLIAPAVASTRAARTNEACTVHAHALPPIVPVGAESLAAITVAAAGARGRIPQLLVEPPEGRWCRESDPVVTPSVGLPSVAPSPRPAGLVAPRRLVALPAPGSGSYSFPVPSRRRGIFVLPAEPVWVRDPFGLFAARGPTVPSMTVVVHPRADPEARWPAPALLTAEARHTETVAYDPGTTRDGTGDLVGLRPYVEGDRLSLLHWPSHARFGIWFVRQFGAESDDTARLVLDDRAGVHRRSDFERLLSSALGLVEAAARQGRPVELLTLTGQSFEFPPVPLGIEQARIVLAALQPRRAPAGRATGSGVVLTTATGALSIEPSPTEQALVVVDP